MIVLVTGAAGFIGSHLCNMNFVLDLIILIKTMKTILTAKGM